MTLPALLAEVRRGEAVEVWVRGHVAVADVDGLLDRAGDAAAATTLRSAVKPLQALAFVESGAADALGAGDAELAVACASHDGTPAHVAAVRRLLALGGLDEARLSCGAHPPYGAEAARALVREGLEPSPVHNNCSGKHAAMLAVCVHRGWPVDGYATVDHPLQEAIAATMSDLMGLDLAAGPRGVDGCGLPTFAPPLTSLAAGLARAQAERPAFRRLQDAMAARPELVAGSGRFDTALLGAWGARLTAKSGGAAVWAAVARPGGPAVALKLEAGVGQHLAPIAVGVLEELGLLDGGPREALAEVAAGEVRNWAGDVVGATEVRVRLDAGGRSR